MSTRDYLTRLGGLAAGTRFDGLSAPTVAAARAVTLDTLGAILAGSRLTENARLADLVAERSGSRTATLVGHARKAEPMLAALAKGTAGAAVAVARLRGHDAAAMRTVINLATSMSPANSWQPCFEGATIRNLYPGRSNMQGILATHLLACGYTAVHDAPSDLYGTILGERFDQDAVVEGVSTEDRVAVYRIERNYFKFHACCLYNHVVLDAVQSLVHAEGFSAHDVQRIRVTSLPFVTRMADPSPANMLAAKFSVPYAVAAAVVKGTTDVSAFTDAVREDPRVRQLATRIEVAGDDTMSMRGGPDRATARVSVELGDGRVLKREAAIVYGDTANPRPRQDLEAKFRALASDTLDGARVNEVVEMAARLEDLPDIRSLTALVTPAR